MALTLLSNSTLVQRIAASITASSRSLIDFSVGSVLRAVVEAFSGVTLWVQYLVLQVLQFARAATATASDLDSWMADFSLIRLPAVASSGFVTFSRYSPTAQAYVAPGVTVKTADGSQTFTVFTDPANAAWSASQGSYSLPPSTASITIPVVAAVGGTAGNVQAATITLIASAIPGVDTVTNASPFTVGIDQENDVALRARFVNYINSLFKATKLAIGYAISTVQQGLTYTIAENATAGGSYSPGNFVVTVDNGTGSPGAFLLAAIQVAVDAVRPVGSTYLIQGPSVVTATISFTLTAATGYVKATMATTIQTALTAFINALPMGAALPYSRIAQVVYDATPGVANVTALLVNSGTADIGGAIGQCVRAGTVTVN